ncbi:MAG: hypothetical protein IJE08_02115 [Clostridia bacterium]|nr:hypothetical protein [Clostridia bacterium]
MQIIREEYTKELDTLLWRSDVPAPREDIEYYTARKPDGQLIAAGALWKSWIYPERIRFFVSVKEMYQGRGFGTMIFRKMQEEHPGAKWQGSADFENDGAEWWLRGLGFDFLYRTYCMDVMLPDFTEEAQYDMEIRSLSELTEEQQLRVLSMAWTDYARKREKYDPLGAEVDAFVFFRYVLGQVDGKKSCCLTDGDEIRAYALCGEGDGEWTADVRQTGHRLEKADDFRRFLIEFVSRAFCETGGLMMNAESFDHDALTLLGLFGELPEDSYDTYALG